jgi:virulence-associated protein VapD
MNIWGLYMTGLTSLFMAAFAHAGAWPTAVGEGQVISTTLFDNAKSGYDDDGKLTQQVSFNKSEGAIYWEHGLTEKTTVVLQSSIQDIQFTAGVDSVNFSGVGESYAGLRRVFWQNEKWVVSGQAGVIFAGSGEAIADADLGTGTTHYESRFLVGRSFKLAKRDGFVDIQAAYRYRPGTQPDERRFDATLGWRPSEKLQILAQGFYTGSEEQFEIARSNRRLKLQGSIVYERSPKTSYQFGVYQTIAGRNIVKENAFFIAAWKRY